MPAAGWGTALLNVRKQWLRWLIMMPAFSGKANRNLAIRRFLTIRLNLTSLVYSVRACSLKPEGQLSHVASVLTCV